jgi:hypothetical protein
VICGLAVRTAVAIGAWHLGWFVERKNVDRQTQVDNASLGRQQAIESEVLRKIDDVRSIDTQPPTSDTASYRKAVVTSVCDLAGQLTGSVTLPSPAQTFLSQECPK